MTLREWLSQRVASPQWQSDWEVVDREYRAGKISANDYLRYKERILDQRTSWPYKGKK